MQHYFVSYTVAPTSGTGTRYKQYAVLPTDDLAEVVAQIVPSRRRVGRDKMKDYLKEYAERGYISIGSPAKFWAIKDIKIKKLPERDKNVLAKYQWTGLPG
jgi:hypothetical protein